MNKKSKMLGIALLLMVVGFAAVATTLTINGTIKFTSNGSDFEGQVVFTEAVIDGTDVTSTAISADGKTITFTTKTLKDLNETSVLNYEITNNSRNYDANVSINCVKDTEESPNTYYSITSTDTPARVNSGETESGSVTVTLTNLSTETRQGGFTCTLSVSADEKTKAPAAGE